MMEEIKLVNIQIEASSYFKALNFTVNMQIEAHGYLKLFGFNLNQK